MNHSFGFYGQHQRNEAIKSGATVVYGVDMVNRETIRNVSNGQIKPKKENLLMLKVSFFISHNFLLCTCIILVFQQTKKSERVIQLAPLSIKHDHYGDS